MNEMNFYTLNGEQYEVADKKAREANTATNESLKLKADISYTNQNFAPALPITLNGMAVNTDMVSPVEHEVDCSVSSLNMVPYPFTNEPVNQNGLTFTNNGDGTFTINGTATDTVVFTYFEGYEETPEGVYSLTGMPFIEENFQSQLAKIDVLFTDASVSGDTGSTDYGKGASFTIKRVSQDYPIKVIQMRFVAYAGAKFSSTIIKPCFTMTANPQPFVPYIHDLSVITVTQQPGNATFKPSRDGIITGMISKSPSMQITTDNPGATISATYNADAKKYIDKKFAELQAAILSTGGNV